MRLYIKNLAKQATETVSYHYKYNMYTCYNYQDLRYIYGSYINWDSEADKNR